MIPIDKARTKLLTIWLIGLGLLFFLMMARSIYAFSPNGIDLKRLGDMWSWFVSQVMPIVGMMVGVIAANAMAPESGMCVRAFTYKASLWVSLFYLVILGLTMTFDVILLSILNNQPNLLDILSVSGFWLSPINAIVITLLGALFISAKPS